ncbi:hypothetical protein B0I35DRAFT_478963 [Stachybotrys elegans]|uniref:CASTOR ACT domain-containing protein n=1 Tax=Stachybotrys elegans TaxID=80388 RepID=A0A8K0WQK5_9HYPO|nr:hypothetical protein B0I35DRAFT_478963 [Stachybotrys elegans]
MNAQIAFLSGTYHLIHIPLNVYATLLQPILRILLPQSQSLQVSHDSSEPELEQLGLTIDGQHTFLNISITPIECSIVCHSAWTRNVFEPAVKSLPKDAAKAVSISRDTYTILSVISAGLDAASRVVDLSLPAALAGIPIFFITTYYSDFILSPAKDRQNVIQALLAKGFELTENQSNFVSSSNYGHRRGSSQPQSPPNTPPPSTVSEMQTRTFDLLKKRNVMPYIDDGLELVQCSGRETAPQLSEIFSPRPSMGRNVASNGHRRTWVDHIDPKFYTCITSALVSQPRFISLLGIFGDSLVGDTDHVLIPIFLDLVNLPFEASGIVCGVAGRLVQEMTMVDSPELSYLSTARAGAVILSQEQSALALGILTPLLTKEA